MAVGLTTPTAYKGRCRNLSNLCFTKKPNREAFNLRQLAFECKMYILYSILAGLAVVPFLLYISNPYFLQDLRYSIICLLVGIRFGKYSKSKPLYSIVDNFLDKVKKHPDKPFLVFENTSYTYEDTDIQSNKVARALSQHADIKAGDSVALFLGNEPMYVWIWLALTKLGCTAALLNCNIRSKSLLHCFSCSDAKVLIVASGELNLIYSNND